MKMSYKKYVNIQNLTLILSLAALGMGACLFYVSNQRYENLQREDTLVQLKLNETTARLYNLQNCFDKGDTTCPLGKYNNNQVWMDQIDNLLKEIK